MTDRELTLKQPQERDEQALPQGWVWTTLGEVTQPVEKVKPKENPDEEFIYLDISSIDNSINVITEPKVYRGADAPSRARQLVRADDVLFSTVRTYLKNIALVPEKYDGQIASTGFSVLRGEEGVLGKYLFYFTLTNDFLATVGKLQRGVSYPAVRDRDVRGQRISLAPSAEQHRIVAEIKRQLTRLDAGLAALKRAQANLRRYKAAVLKAACEGCLVPTEAELARAEGRDYEPADQLPQRILAERRAKWEAEHPGKRYKEPESPDTWEFPELPEGWVWATVQQVAEMMQYGTSEKAGLDPSGIPVLRMGNIQDGRLDFSDLKYFPQEWLNRDKFLLQAGDVLFNRTNSAELVGKTAVYKSFHPPASFASYLIKVKTHCAYLPDFLSYCINSHHGRRYIASVVSQQVGQANVSGTKLARMPIPFPPRAEQHRIVAEVERRLSVVQELEKQVETALKRADRLRQAILKRAFEGKLVAQDPADEPASVLLERIKAEKARRLGEREGEKG